MTNTETLAGLFCTEAIALRRGAILKESPPSMPAGIDLQDKVEGMLLGLAIGDALGNTSEGMLPGARRMAYREIRDYLPNRYAEGRAVGLPSDDTQLAFWTLEQLLEDGRLIPERLAERFASRQIFGIGQTVSKFLWNHHAGKPWHACGPASAGNGALMRIAPVLVPHLAEPSPALWADSALAAMLTHNDGASNSACLAFVAMLWDLLAMDRPPPSDWWLTRYLAVARDTEPEGHYRPRGGDHLGYEGPLWRYLEDVIPPAPDNGKDVADACNGWYSGAYLLETVPSVIYILNRHGDDPEEAIVRAVNDTKDNDTIAAIVGGAVGALHGRQGLPARWVEGLLGRTTGHDDGRVFELLKNTCESFSLGSTTT